VIRDGRQAPIPHVNAFAANLVARHHWLSEFFDQAPLVMCDGDGIRFACRALNMEVPPKVTYSRWLPLLAEYCQRNDFSLYLLGSRAGVAALAGQRFMSDYPGLRVVGSHHGYFNKTGPENDAVIADIERAKPDILLVCFGMPLQERWVRDNASRLAAHVILTGGAAIDYAAGVAPLTPRIFIDLQLEWLYRFLRDPARLFARYALGNPEFMARVAAARLKQARSGGRDVRT
jgi:N-acetylglucosaminyldiphosphoundecaprenol N-acetyl-beta-D-mannosaminyltransferase